MIGCMSFPVASLVGPEQGLNGWYQLLDEEKGLTENQPVPVSISQSASGVRHPVRPGTCEIAVSRSFYPSLPPFSLLLLPPPPPPLSLHFLISKTQILVHTPIIGQVGTKLYREVVLFSEVKM